jgi:methylated-DNA-[protein]-cysteine S-methyltransferase
MLLAASPQGLRGAWFTQGQRDTPAPTTLAHWTLQAEHPVLQQACTQLADYFAARRTVFELPLDLSGGTAFQQVVWQALRGIAHGQTSHYGDMAHHIGRPSAVRALGGAVGRNPISIIVPCHRVLGADGKLTGYSGGLERKTALLQLEGVL